MKNLLFWSRNFGSCLHKNWIITYQGSSKMSANVWNRSRCISTWVPLYILAFCLVGEPWPSFISGVLLQILRLLLNAFKLLIYELLCCTVGIKYLYHWKYYTYLTNGGNKCYRCNKYNSFKLHKSEEKCYTP